MSDDRLAAELAAIRERYCRRRLAFMQEDLYASAEDVASLLAAVEAVLKLAGQMAPQAPSYSALEEDRMWIRQECADMIREAITSALLGES
jgi:hypothetical protein